MSLKEKLSKMAISFALPVFLFVVLIWGFVNYGPLGVLEGNFPPVKDVVIQRVVFEPGVVKVEVFNNGPEDVVIAQAMMNEIYWQFKMVPEDKMLEPLKNGEMVFNYPWFEGDPLGITVVLSDGLTFDKEVDVSFLTPVVNKDYIKTFVLLGLYVGVIPVLLGLLWLPFLRRLKDTGYMFMLALTVGLLLFLGFDALAESIEMIADVPSVLNGVGLLVIGFVLSILVLGAVSYKVDGLADKKGSAFKSISWAYLIALGIGVHNMGEGLAIGSSYAVGEIALGASLVVGFMAHNLTEGIAIVSPLTRISMKRGKFIRHILLMGLIAGLPTILGTLIGGFAYSPVLALFFLAIGAGAIFDVCFDIINYMAKGKLKSLFTITNVVGFLSGLLIMYSTGLILVA